MNSCLSQRSEQPRNDTRNLRSHVLCVTLKIFFKFTFAFTKPLFDHPGVLQNKEQNAIPELNCVERSTNRARTSSYQTKIATKKLGHRQAARFQRAQSRRHDN